ncbi:MAG: exo-beta-N-acetylmuramidase NamZ family protein [Daejeonella sp.]
MIYMLSRFIPFLLVILISFSYSVYPQRINTGSRSVPDPRKVDVNAINRIKGKIKTGADQTGLYLSYLKGKRIGMVVNPTSIIGNATSVDSLKALGVNIVKIFGPEHGFRGDASAGVKVDDSFDARTGIPAISLYGKHHKPSKQDMAGIDLMVFDIQDVGARFYTYINTLQYVMEACAESNKELLILDRPNPNGFYVDGPILDPKLKSGVGVNPIPIVHGLTIAEYAQMLNGEGWLANKVRCKIKVIKIANYAHGMTYKLPVKPSPNLNTQQAILLYPSLCLFEGTIISQGRGTTFPFTVLGNPDLKGKYKFSFMPKSIKGMSETPLHQDKNCYGLDLREYNTNKLRNTGKINLSWLIELYKAYPYKAKFFDFKQSNQMGNFDKLAGTENLKQQIIEGKSEQEIRDSWEPGLSQYKIMRKKYLLYQ